MATCHTCGNDYAQAFTVTMKGQSYDFDSFECAITALAPTCAHCDCRVIGHGVQAEGAVYCCVHCARAAGVEGLRDHA